jgi:hypothetical protein
MVKEVTEKDNWTQREIEDRENKILAWARTAWADIGE